MILCVSELLQICLYTENWRKMENRKSQLTFFNIYDSGCVSPLPKKRIDIASIYNSLIKSCDLCEHKWQRKCIEFSDGRIFVTAKDPSAWIRQRILLSLRMH